MSAPDLTKEGVAGDGKIILASGEWFDVLNPNPEDVDIEDIAASLSKQCRFTGHTRRFYSTAQHCVLVHDLLEEMGYSPNVCFQGLLHDASEAYLSDIARPIKRHPEFGPFYTAVERRLEKAIMDRYALTYPFHEAIHLADSVLLRSEARDLMPPTFPVYDGTVLPFKIVSWEPWRAEDYFLSRAEEYV